MKIAILTLLEQLNYGGILQALALSSFLRQQGYEADVLRLEISPGNSSLYGNVIAPKRLLGLRNLRLIFRVQYNGGWAFRETIRRLRTIRFIKENVHTNGFPFSKTELPVILKDYDVAIVGSDQVWNPNYYGMDNAFLLDGINNIRKIAYAASFGLHDFPEKYASKYAAAISDFSHISCREKSGVDIVKSLTGSHSMWVVDPLMLPSRNFWLHLTGGMEDEKYIFVYWLGDLEALFLNLLKVREYSALPIRLLLSEYLYGMRDFRKGNALVDKILKEIKGVTPFFQAGPKDFYQLLAHSTALITDSFHGMVFSVIYEKPFWVYEATMGERATLLDRIKDFTNRLGFESRVSHNIDARNLFTPIKLHDNHLLEKWRDESRTFLLDSLR